MVATSPWPPHQITCPPLISEIFCEWAIKVASVSLSGSTLRAPGQGFCLASQPPKGDGSGNALTLADLADRH